MAGYLLSLRKDPVDGCRRGLAQLEVDVTCCDEETDKRNDSKSELHRLLEHEPRKEAYREHDERGDDRSWSNIEYECQGTLASTISRWCLLT